MSEVGPSESNQAEQVETVDVVVIGAGFVGLAAGAALAASPASHGKVRILESGDSVGHFWVGGHEQLSLHSPYHKLPHDGGLSREYPMFKTKHDVRDYLARYAEAHGLQENLRLGRRVTALEHSAEGPAASPSHPWRVQTDVPGETYLARRVVVATGLNREPHVPRFEGRESFRGEVRHSWHVRECSGYQGKHVLLVGSGNSGAELAVALHEAGAASIDMLVDGPRHFVSRTSTGRFFSLLELLGVNTDTMVHDLHRATFGPARGAATVGFAAASGAGAAPSEAEQEAGQEAEWRSVQASQDATIRFLSADLARFGVGMPAAYPSAEHDALARIPVYDVDDVAARDATPRQEGLIGLIRSGKVNVLRGRIERFTASGVLLGAATSTQGLPPPTAATATATAASSAAGVLAGTVAAPTVGAPCEAALAERRYDAVILATGFRPKLLDFLRGGVACALVGRGADDTADARGGADDTPSHPAALPSKGRVSSNGGVADHGRRGEAVLAPLVDRRSRSTVRDSIYFVGFDQFRSTLSIGPVLGFRGYDVGAEIASELYPDETATPRTRVNLPYPSLPADEQTASKVEWTPRQMLVVLGVGAFVGAVGGRFMGARTAARATRRVLAPINK